MLPNDAHMKRPQGSTPAAMSVIITASEENGIKLPAKNAAINIPSTPQSMSRLTIKSILFGS
jgi:hypothetical protein